MKLSIFFTKLLTITACIVFASFCSSASPREDVESNVDSEVNNLNNELPADDILTADQLLNNPVYDQEIQVTGVVGVLGMVNCTCFELSSGESTISVYYDMMAENDQTQRPSVDVDHISNGDTVIVTGELKSAGDYRQENDFWASNIEISE